MRVLFVGGTSRAALWRSSGVIDDLGVVNMAARRLETAGFSRVEKRVFSLWVALLGGKATSRPPEGDPLHSSE